MNPYSLLAMAWSVRTVFLCRTDGTTFSSTNHDQTKASSHLREASRGALVTKMPCMVRATRQGYRRTRKVSEAFADVKFCLAAYEFVTHDVGPIQRVTTPR